MKAIVQNEYGSPDVFELKEIDKPVVKDDDVLVRVHAAALHAGDYFAMRGVPYLVRMSAGWPKPKNYVPGYEVFGACKGTCAEYVCAGENNFLPKPANLTLEQAAAVPTSALTALRGLRDAGKVQPGQKVLINGASGGVGTFAVQIAKVFGAEVTGVCSTRNVEMVRSIGADHVIDYTQDRSAQTMSLITPKTTSRKVGSATISSSIKWRTIR
jgi:NADPH:quinone reductase-like Zn-dependent oxidoreductase